MSNNSGLFSRYAFTEEHSDVKTAERALNAAILRGRINEGFEEYLEIFDSFYAEDIEVSSERNDEAIKGKEHVRALLVAFLAPLHVIIEVGSIDVLVVHEAVVSDVENETQSEWSVDLVAPSGKSCSLKWRTFRKWKGANVIYEHHYDLRQMGGPLTFEDLRLGSTGIRN